MKLNITPHVIELRAELEKEAIKMAELQKLVNSAQHCDDYLENLPDFQQFSKHGIDIVVRTYEGCPEDFSDWVFDLTLRNMREFYDDSWPWNEKEKFYAQNEECARYLIAFSDGQPIGFLRFQFEQHEGKFIIFLHDLQIELDYQDHGIGSFLVESIVAVGKEFNVDGILTIIFNSNGSIIEFLKKFGFREARSSPEILYPEKTQEYKHSLLYFQYKR